VTLSNESERLLKLFEDAMPAVQRAVENLVRIFEQYRQDPYFDAWVRSYQKPRYRYHPKRTWPMKRYMRSRP